MHIWIQKISIGLAQLDKIEGYSVQTVHENPSGPLKKYQLILTPYLSTSFSRASGNETDFLS